MILQFIQRARRRYLWNEMLAQCALGAALLMGGLVLLLLFGTQILDWRLVAALGALVSGIALCRTWRRTPANYRIAVFLDSRADLQDSLSTALFFHEKRHSARIPEPMRLAQRKQAENLIPTVNLEGALPFRIPRALYAMSILGLVASSLFALRYGTRRQLDWKPPITQLVMEELGFRNPEAKQAALTKKTSSPKPADLLDDPGMPLPLSGQKKQGELDGAPQSALDTVNTPDVNNEKVQTSGKAADGKADGDEKNAGEQDEAGQTDSGAQATSGKSPDNPPGSREGPQQGEQSAGKQTQGSNSSLISKMKEAMSNLLSKAKPQPNASGGQKPTSGQDQQKAQSQQKGGGKGAPNQDQKNGQQDLADAQQGDQAGEPENSENAQGTGAGKSSDQQAAARPGSGIGKQDGNKDVKAAEQLAAMGKLSEIIGKRSQNVSGEIMMEVESGPQQLHTAYSKQKAEHGESGGETSRDEIPVALQSYIQKYFQEVRKAEHAGSGTGKPATAAKP